MRNPLTMMAIAIIAFCGLGTPGTGEARLRLFYAWGAEHPSTLRTRLGGETPVRPRDFTVVHESRSAHGPRVTWKMPRGSSCRPRVERDSLDTAANTIAGWTTMPEVQAGLKNRAPEVTVYLVPENHSFELRQPILRLMSPVAQIAFGVHHDCESTDLAGGTAAMYAVHELAHIALRKKDLPRLSEEAVAYTAQACAHLDATERLPSANEVAHSLPPILLDLFRDSTPTEFLSRRLPNEPDPSLRGGILSQLNIGLFLGAEPIESREDPRSIDLDGYCDCIYSSTPDFTAYKPGEIWAMTGGADCRLSAPATAPHSGR